MKIETEKSGFKNVELKITIESLAELKMMALLFNTPFHKLEPYDEVVLNQEEFDATYPFYRKLFCILDDELINQGFKAGF